MSGGIENDFKRKKKSTDFNQNCDGQQPALREV
jgi:hypothetical protein